MVNVEDVAKSLYATVLSKSNKHVPIKLDEKTTNQRKWTRRNGVRKTEEVQKVLREKIVKEIKGGKPRLVEVQVAEGSIGEWEASEKKRKQADGGLQTQKNGPEMVLENQYHLQQ